MGPRRGAGWRVSTSLHHSLDGTRVVNYAQARDGAAMARVFRHLTGSGFIARNTTLGVANPGLYEVAATVQR